MKVLFLGTGVMGSPMAINLAAAGYAVSVWNRNPDRDSYLQALENGCQAVDDTAEAAASADVIVSCLKDEASVAACFAADGALIKACRRGSTIIDMTTTGPAIAKRLQQSLAERGVDFLDAPVSGGDIGAINGSLTIMVGGEQKAYERSLPLLKAMGEQIHYCGGAGAGQSVKLVNQLLAAVHMRATCEALHFAKSMDLDLAQVVDICASGAAGSWAWQNLGKSIVEDKLEPGFSLDLMLKDIRLIRENAVTVNENLEALALAEQAFTDCVATDQRQQFGTQAMIRCFTEEPLA